MKGRKVRENRLLEKSKEGEKDETEEEWEEKDRGEGKRWVSRWNAN